jgi:hypothetical protein
MTKPNNESKADIKPETAQVTSSAGGNTTPLAEDWHTLSRSASELGVSVTWLESFCVKHRLTIRKAKNPHYSSASPMKLIEINALNRCFAAEPEALANAQKRSNRARKASATVAIREKQKLTEAQRRLAESGLIVKSLGSLEESLFWFGHIVYSGNYRQVVDNASWELLGRFLASGGKLFQSEKTVFWQFSSGLGVYVPRQLLKIWPWVCLLPHIELAEFAVTDDRSESTVTIRRPFGKTETVKTVDSQVACHRFLEAFGKTDAISPGELNEPSERPEDNIWVRFNIAPHDAKIWKHHQFSAQQALAYTACGIGVGEARSFAEVGLDILKEPNVILLWKDDLYRLKDWIFHGINAQFALQWENAGFSPEEGAIWSELKVPPRVAAVLAGRNDHGFSLHPQQFQELITNLQQIRELKSKRNQISDHLISLLSIGLSFEDIESVLLRFHTRDLLNRRCLELLLYLLHKKMPISIASDSIMQLAELAERTNMRAERMEHILQLVARLWENRPNMEMRTLIAWASSKINVETALRLIDLGVSVQEAKQYKTLFRRSPKTTKTVLSRIANGEALDYIAKSFQRPKKPKVPKKPKKVGESTRASRRAWAEFFRVNAQLIPPDFGPFDRAVIKSFQTGRSPVPEYILNRWNETNQIPRWAISLGLGH